MNNVIASHVWEQISSLKGEERAEFCLSQGIEAYKVENYEASVALCGAAVDIFRNLNISSKYRETLSAYTYLSYSTMKLGRFKEAACLSVTASNWLYKFNEMDGRDAFEFAADCFLQSGDYDDAITIYEYVISDSLNITPDEGLAILRFSVAFCYQNKAMFPVAIENYILSRELFLSAEDPKAVARVDEELSLCFYSLGLEEEATQSAQSALDFAILMNDPLRLRISHNRMGRARIAKQEIDTALAHLRRAKQLATTETDPDWQFIVDNEELIALALDIKGAKAEAKAIRDRIKTIKTGSR